LANFYLTGTLGPNPIRFDLTVGTHSVGRTHDCDIVILDAAISRNHAQITVEEAAIKVRDLDSLNGTRVNGKPVKGEISVFLGDRIQFGQATLTLREEEDKSVRLGGFDTSDDTQSQVHATITTTLKEIQDQSKSHRGQGLLAAVSKAGALLSRRMEMEEIYTSVLDLLEQELSVNRILILGPDAETQEVFAARTRNEKADTPLRMSRTMLQSILEDGKSFVTTDASTDDQWDAAKSIVQLGVRAAMGAPLFDNDRILGVLYVDSQTGGVVYNEDDLRLLTLLANMVAVKMTNSRLEAEERALETLRQELSVAARIQRNLLPASTPEVTGYGIFAHQDPCDDIGGDLFDVHRLPDGRIWAVLGDVTGHGIAAALLMSHVMAGLHILEEQCDDPLALVTRLEAFLGPRVEVGQFVTLFAGLIDPATGRMNFVNAGGMPPLILGPDSSDRLPTTGPPVAILGDVQERESEATTLKPGHVLLMASDGITEFSRNGVQYDEGRMQAFLKTAASRDARDLGSSLLKDLQEFGAGAPAEDDLTLLVVKRN
jgi:serine phosphatase RsbU (regulator of sigma subunit)/pSer/pThr/pTyr-binding forkhead associated (FHA) protein